MYKITGKLLVMAVCVILYACGGGGSSAPKSPPSVELNADSICDAKGIPTTCAKMLPANWVVDDRAVAGLTLHSLSVGYSAVWVGGPLGKNGPQVAFDKTPHPSTYVVVQQGINDAYEARDPLVFEAELRAILLHIKALGKIPVVTGVLPFRASPTGFDSATITRAVEFNSIVHRVALELGVLDAHWDKVPFNPDTDTVDDIHRTEAAVRALVIRLQETINGDI